MYYLGNLKKKCVKFWTFQKLDFKSDLSLNCECNILDKNKSFIQVSKRMLWKNQAIKIPFSEIIVAYF